MMMMMMILTSKFYQNYVKLGNAVHKINQQSRIGDSIHKSRIGDKKL